MNPPVLMRTTFRRHILTNLQKHPSSSPAPLPRPTLTCIHLPTTQQRHKTSFPPRPKPPPDSEIEESYLKGSGPGGQKINKTNSAVQLQHIPTGIVVKSQATRSRSQNRKIARELLAQRLDEHFNGPQSRSAIVGDIKKKRSDSAAKKSRRKYRKLEEEEAEADKKGEGRAATETTTIETGTDTGSGSVRFAEASVTATNNLGRIEAAVEADSASESNEGVEAGTRDSEERLVSPDPSNKVGEETSPSTSTPSSKRGKS